MSVENEALVRRWFDEVWNQKRADVIDVLFAPDGVAHGLADGGTDLHGPEGFKAAHTVFCQAFPDLHITVDHTVSNGDEVATRFTCRGTHGGDLFGIPATNRPVIFTGITITRFRKGQIVEGWNKIDFLSMLQQVGAVPLMKDLT